MITFETAPDFLTTEEVSALLRVKPESIGKEIDAGRLSAISIAGERRIMKRDVQEFLEVLKGRKISSANGTEIGFRKEHWSELLKPAADFKFVWPHKKGEKDKKYTEAFEDVRMATAKIENHVREIKIGFTNRTSAGQERRRAVIFIDCRPILEFNGANDFDKSGLMASVIKKNGKQIRSSESLPAAYRNFKVETYNSYVIGPYASSNLAVVCTKDDLGTMMEHALIRLKEIEENR